MFGVHRQGDMCTHYGTHHRRWKAKAKQVRDELNEFTASAACNHDAIAMEALENNAINLPPAIGWTKR